MIKGSSSSVIQKTEVEAGECKCFPRIPSIKGPIPCHWICYSHTQKVGFEHNCLKHKMRQNVTIRNVTFCLHLPCEQLVSPTLVQERNYCEQPFDFPSSMCEVRHTPRDVFDITSFSFEENHYTAGSPKRSSYAAERPRKRQNKFTNSFYRFKFNLFVLGAGRRLTQRN